MCEPSTLTPWDAQTKRIHPSEGKAPALQADNKGGQRMPYVSISSSGGSRASRSAWPGDGTVSLMNVLSGLSFDESCPNCGQSTPFSKMFRDFYPRVAARRASGAGFTSDAIVADAARSIRASYAANGAEFKSLIAETLSDSSSPTWLNSGSVGSHGEYWTANSGESRSAAGACSLSQVLQSEVPSKYFLSAKAAAGILRRAERRGKVLPPQLSVALSEVARGDRTTPTAAPTSPKSRTRSTPGTPKASTSGRT